MLFEDHFNPLHTYCFFRRIGADGREKEAVFDLFLFKANDPNDTVRNTVQLFH